MDKLRELFEELKLVFSNRNSILDSVIPPLLFMLANALLGLAPALWAAFGGSLLFILLRLFRREPLKFALAGAGATARWRWGWSCCSNARRLSFCPVW